MSATGTTRCMSCGVVLVYGATDAMPICGPCRRRWNANIAPPPAALSQSDEDILQILRQQQTVMECLIGDLWHYSGHTERIPASRIGELGRLLKTARELLSKYPYKEK